jgi:Tol biopolymer transport system component
VSGTGSLVYVPRRSDRAAGASAGWYSAEKFAFQPLPLEELTGLPTLSDDGKRIAWAGPVEGVRTDLHVADAPRGAITRITHDGVNSSPVWSPGGQRLHFARRDTGLFRIAAIDADGGNLSLLPAAARNAFPGAVSSDGRFLAFVLSTVNAKGDIWIVPISGSSAPREVVHSPFDEMNPALSPDGSLLAYQSDEGGRWDVYVQRLADGRRAIVSTAGGDRPLWSPDGTSIVYRSGASLLRASVRAETLTVSDPAIISELRIYTPLGLGPDGRVLVERVDGASTSAVIALHWDREARRLLGPAAGVMPR